MIEIERFKEYVTGDPRPKRISDCSSLMLAFAWYVISIFSLQFTPAQALIQSLALFIACEVAFTFWYCRSAMIENYGKERRNMFISASGFAALLAALVVLSRPRRTEAAILTNRLRQLANNPEGNASKIASSLISIANKDSLVLPKRPIEQIVAHRLTLDDVRLGVLNNVNKEAIEHGIPLPVVGLVVSKTEEIGQVLLGGISAEGVNLEKFEVDPKSGSLVPPDMVAFAEPIGSRPTVPVSRGAGLIRINGSGVTISLDGLYCKNVIFVDCTIVFSGKALILQNSGFYNSKFQFSENITCQLLAEAILTNPSLTLTLR
jgi:hypothetical protein